MMPIEAICERYPRLYHMAELGSLGSLIKYGIESTASLCRRYEVETELKKSYLTRIREQSITLSHPAYPDATIRDQCALTESRLTHALGGSCSNEEWCQILNTKVFFWAEPHRLKTIMSAPLYKDRTHDVLVLNTESVLRENADKVRLSSMNTGNTNPPNARTPETFKSINSIKGMRNVVEVTVEDRVGNIEKHLERFARVSIDDLDGVI